MLTEKIFPININTVNFADARFQNIMKERYVPLVRKHSFFRNVRDYIRANTVNEYEVAEHFHIPLRQIKEWIREGPDRIS